MIFLHFWHTMYWPVSGPWYDGAIWGNVFVVPVAAVLGWLWARTKFWPLKPIERHVHNLHAKVDAIHARHDEHDAQMQDLKSSLEELHRKHDALHDKLRQ